MISSHLIELFRCTIVRDSMISLPLARPTQNSDVDQTFKYDHVGTNWQFYDLNWSHGVV